MAVTSQDLVAFNRFAEQKISNGGVDSIEELVREWVEDRALIESIEQSEADIAAGRVKPLDQAFADIRRKLGFPE